MSDLSPTALEAFLAAAAARLRALRPELAREDAEAFAFAALPPISANEDGILILASEDGRTLEVPLEDFDPYEVLEKIASE